MGFWHLELFPLGGQQYARWYGGHVQLEVFVQSKHLLGDSPMI